MGFVNKLRGVFGGTADESTVSYECETCGAEFDSHRTTCSSCGDRNIVPAGS